MPKVKKVVEEEEPAKVSKKELRVSPEEGAQEGSNGEPPKDKVSNLFHVRHSYSPRSIHARLVTVANAGCLLLLLNNNRKEQDRMLSHVHIKAAADIDDEQPVQEDIPAPSM
eukprot:18817-Heterococcus_DN1.PRE.2